MEHVLAAPYLLSWPKKELKSFFFSALKASATPSADLPLNIEGKLSDDLMDLSKSSNDCGTTVPCPYGNA